MAFLNKAMPRIIDTAKISAMAIPNKGYAPFVLPCVKLNNPKAVNITALLQKLSIVNAVSLFIIVKCDLSVNNSPIQ